MDTRTAPKPAPAPTPADDRREADAVRIRMHDFRVNALTGVRFPNIVRQLRRALGYTRPT